METMTAMLWDLACIVVALPLLVLFMDLYRGTSDRDEHRQCGLLYLSAVGLLIILMSLILVFQDVLTPWSPSIHFSEIMILVFLGSATAHLRQYRLEGKKEPEDTNEEDQEEEAEEPKEDGETEE